jgi:hypothetical protein
VAATWPEDHITGANSVLAWAVGHRTKAYQCTCTVTKECVICKIVRREWTEADGAEFLEDEDELA